MFYFGMFRGHFWVKVLGSRHSEQSMYSVFDEESETQVTNKQLFRARRGTIGKAYLRKQYFDYSFTFHFRFSREVRCRSMIRKAQFSARVWKILRITQENQGKRQENEEKSKESRV